VQQKTVFIKGAGDLASGVAYVFGSEGYAVIMTEIPEPTCVRRMVSFAEAVYEGKICVQGMWGRLARTIEEGHDFIRNGDVVIFVDAKAQLLAEIKPQIFIDATMAKKNLGTKIDDADVVIALGPGFEAGKDVHAVIETHRAGNLGKPIYHGTAIPNTGVPGEVLGYTSQRVLRAPGDGVFYAKASIGDFVDTGNIVALVDDKPVVTEIAGVVRGLLRSGLTVRKGLKVGDIHPEKDKEACYTITDKAMVVGYGALQAYHEIKSGVEM